MERIPEFKFRDKTFSTIEEIKEYDNSLWDTFFKADYKDEECGKERTELSEELQKFIFSLLHSFTVTKDYPKPAKPDEYGEKDWGEGELEASIVALMDWNDWFWNCNDEEITDRDLEKSYEDVIAYYNSPYDDNICYAVSYTHSPYNSYDEYDYELFAVKKIPVQKYAYERIDAKEEE